METDNLPIGTQKLSINWPVKEDNLIISDKDMNLEAFDNLQYEIDNNE